MARDSEHPEQPTTPPEVSEAGTRRRRRNSGARRMGEETGTQPLPRAVTARDHDPYAALAALAATGDLESTEQLLRLLSPRIYAVGRSLLGASHRDLDDVAQECLLAFFRALPSFERRSTVLHFATRISVRTCLAHRKRNRRREARELTAEEASATEPLAQTTELDETAHRRREAVRALLEALPDVQAEALALRVCLGMSLAQVAAATDSPQNTVRSRLRLARQALLRRVEDDASFRALVEDAT